MRWKFVIPVFTFILVAVLFTVFFMDSLVRRSMISTGESIFGAKVEIASVKTRFKDLSININGIKIADKNDYWKNIFEMDNIRFGLKPLPLLSKKVIIEEMTVDGIRWGTKRTTSGELSAAKREAIEKEKKRNAEGDESITSKLLTKIKEKGSSELNALPAVETLKNAGKEFKDISADKLIQAADLSSIKEMETMKTDLQGKFSQYESRLQNLKIQETVDRTSKAASEVSKIKVETVQDIAPAQEKINALNQSRQELDKSISDIKTLKTQLSSDIGDEKAVLSKINESREADFKAISAKMKLPSLSLGNMSEYLFGPVWVQRVNNVVYYMHLARKYMPERKKEDKKMMRKRLKGMDVEFPVENRPPSLLIQKVALSGTTGGPGKEGEEMIFSGTVTDITSDPVLVGRPTVFEVNGTQGEKELQLKGIFDHSIPIPSDTLRIRFSGLDSQNVSLPKSDYLPSFDNGQASITSEFVLKGDEIDGRMDFSMDGLSSPKEDGKNDELRSVINGLWSGITKISVNARMYGKSDALQWSFSSNIDSVLGDRMKNLYGQKYAEVQNRVKAEIARLTEEKQKEVLAEFSSRKNALLKEYSAKEKELQDKIDSVRAQITTKENEIKGQGEREKKKAEDEIKKQAEDKLKSLFKR